MVGQENDLFRCLNLIENVEYGAKTLPCFDKITKQQQEDALKNADIKIIMHDLLSEDIKDSDHFIDFIDDNTIIVFNKIDEISGVTLEKNNEDKKLYISAKTGENAFWVENVNHCYIYGFQTMSAELNPVKLNMYQEHILSQAEFYGLISTEERYFLLYFHRRLIKLAQVGRSRSLSHKIFRAEFTNESQSLLACRT
jgi:predicted GTPase